MEQPPGVRRDRLEIAPLRFRVEGAERQRRLAGAGDAGEDDQRVAGNADVDILEVVLARASHLYKAGEAALDARTPGARLLRPRCLRRRVRWLRCHPPAPTVQLSGRARAPDRAG